MVSSLSFLEASNRRLILTFVELVECVVVLTTPKLRDSNAVKLIDFNSKHSLLMDLRNMSKLKIINFSHSSDQKSLAVNCAEVNS